MVKVRQDLPISQDGSVNLEKWLEQINTSSPLVRSAVLLSRVAGEDRATPYGQSCFMQSLEIAEMIASLKFGEEAIAAALVYLPSQYADLSLEDIEDQLDEHVTTLVRNTQHLQDIAILKHAAAHAPHQVDNIRKMLLAMVRDVRVVILKLAERLCLMRAIAHLAIPEQKRLAQETMDIYAPLASRLGISELKWELEDLAFSILHPETYKMIAKGLQERRIDREKRVLSILNKLNAFLDEEHIQGEIHGRAKHIYSIYRKMQRKKVGVEHVYDAIAVRILVPEISDCYAMLGHVHEFWEPIKEEFDDYISHPKPNGYRSIHTAVFDENHKHFEVQIRTYAMHEESEMGVAAHWVYKEGAQAGGGYEEKIKWLRQLLDWQKELTEDRNLPSELEKNVFEDRIYVFTPEGEIVDLPSGSTALDFAYHIHTELGHRCRGAKVGNKIIPLTTPLKMGDTVEILATKESAPSRDWLSPQRGYLKTSRARAKVLNWFKKQDYDQHITHGREIFEKEIKRLNLDEPSLDKLAHQLGYKQADAMLFALGNGDLRIAQIINLLQQELPPAPISVRELIASTRASERKDRSDVHIYGVGDLLTHIAHCCKPIPGDPIVGYVTQGHGISIHHQHCNNLTHLDENHKNRLIEVAWFDKTSSYYPIDLDIKAYDRPGLISDIAQILANDKISITHLTTITDKKQHTAYIQLTIEIKELNLLSKVIDRFQQLPNMIEVTRKKNITGERNG